VSARFDWYQATADAEVAPLLGLLERAIDGTSGTWERMPKAPHGYGFGQRLVDADGQVCMVWWGGCHQLPHVVSSGESAQRVAQVVRAADFRHRVSRADVCLDYAAPGSYDRLQGLLLGVAETRRIKVGTAGDHLLTKAGRTLYLGATSSHTRLRLYDKADELRAKFKADPARLAGVPSELARLEVQVRPQTPEARLSAACADPIHLMGSASWTREAMRLVADLELQPFEAGKPWRQADDDRAYSALLAQYGGLLERKMREHGNWQCLGLQIGSDLAARSAAKRRR
jgi:hypothetical protein